MLELEENLLPRPFQAPLPVPRAVSGFVGVMHAVQEYPFRVSLFEILLCGRNVRKECSQ